MHEPGGCLLSEMSQSKKDKHCLIPRVCGTQKSKAMEIKSRAVDAWSWWWRRAHGQLLLNEYRVSVWEDETHPGGGQRGMAAQECECTYVRELAT